MFDVIFLPVADDEATEAQDWYENETRGLGSRFRTELEAAVERIRDNPLSYPIVYREMRRVLLRRFPYGLYFHMRPEAAYVIACFHASRDPRRWQQRVT